MTGQNDMQNRHIKSTLEKALTENVLHVCYGHIVCEENKLSNDQTDESSLENETHQEWLNEVLEYRRKYLLNLTKEQKEVLRKDKYKPGEW